MTRPVVHATLEFGTHAWGGIASAVSLMAHADAQTRESVVVSPAARSQTVRLGDGLTHLCVAVAGYRRPGDVYRSPTRLAAGAEVAAALMDALRERFGTRPLDVVVHNAELVGAMTGSAVATRAVYFAHGLWRQERPGEPALHDAQSAIFAGPLPVAVSSRPQADLIEHAVVARHVHVVPPPLQLLRASVRRPPEPIAGPPASIVAAGRLVPQKGFDILLRAARALDPAIVGRCDLFGGHGAAAYERLCHRLADGRPRTPVRLHPWRSRDATLAAIAGSGALVVPSRWEALGIVAAEAIAMGVPVVGSRVGGLAELLEASGQAAVPCGADGPAPADLADHVERAVQGPRERPAPDALDRWSAERYRAAIDRCLDTQPAGVSG